MSIAVKTLKADTGHSQASGGYSRQGEVVLGTLKSQSETGTKKTLLLFS